MIDAAYLKEILEKNYSLGKIIDIETVKSGVSNENYRVKTDTGGFFARVAHFEPENQIKVMLPFLEYAETVDFPAPRLVHTKVGAGFVGEQSSPVIVTSAIDGTPGSYETINNAKLSSLGGTLSDLHQLEWATGTDSVTANTGYILGVYDEFAPKFIANDDEDLALCSVLEEEYRYFTLRDTQQKLQNSPKGLIHNDIIPSNVLFDVDSVVAFVDLEEISQGIMLLDVSRVINSWCFSGGAFMPERVRAFLASYDQRRPLSDFELRELPTVMRFVSFRNSVYALKMLVQGRLTSPKDSKDFAQLEYIRVNLTEVHKIVSDLPEARLR